MKSPFLDLFLLTTSLAQIKDQARVVAMFIEGMDHIFPEFGFSWATQQASGGENRIEVCTRHKTYGFLRFDGEAQMEETTRALLQNMCQMMGVILEKLQQEESLLEQNQVLETLIEERAQITGQLEARVAERTAELERANKQLEAAHQATLRSMADTTRARQKAEELAATLQSEVAERRQIEVALRESEERFRLLYENINEGVALHEILTDDNQVPVDLVFLSANPTYEKLTGLKAADIVGKRGLEVIPNMEKKWIDAYGKVAQTGQSINIVDHSDYLDKYWEVKAFALKPNQFAVALNDITERKKAEEALLAAEQKYRNVADHTYDWELWITPEDHYLYCSPSCKRISGYDASEFIADPELFRNLILPEDLPVWDDHRRNTSSSDGGASRIEFRILDKQGSEHWIEHICFPIVDPSGKFLGTRGSNRDISDRKWGEAEREKLQAQLIQAQKMESVGRLAGGVAHDFNNMLSVILGNTEIALDRLDPTHPLFTELKEIRRAAERSVDLTRQLLAFARKQVVAPKVLDLNDTVEGMLKMLRRLIGEDIELSWQPGSSLGPVKMDPSQIDQILANLCINARDAIRGTGKVTIETGGREIDAAYCAKQRDMVPGRYVLLIISDDGCGMDQEILDRLFEPFFTTKELGKGTGLGLSTVYGIVKQNNGFIDVRSQPGKGSTFTVYLPRHAHQTEPIRKATSAESNRTCHETILLVEDEPDMLKLTATLLQRQGYHVLAASTPRDAIQMAEDHTGEIHLLITDVVMPGMNGRDLAKSLLHFSPNLKLLFMSGYTADVIADHGVLQEGIFFIEKPFSMKELAAKVREVLG